MCQIPSVSVEATPLLSSVIIVLSACRSTPAGHPAAGKATKNFQTPCSHPSSVSINKPIVSTPEILHKENPYSSSDS